METLPAELESTEQRVLGLIKEHTGIALTEQLDLAIKLYPEVRDYMYNEPSAAFSSEHISTQRELSTEEVFAVGVCTSALEYRNAANHPIQDMSEYLQILQDKPDKQPRDSIEDRDCAYLQRSILQTFSSNDYPTKVNKLAEIFSGESTKIDPELKKWHSL